MSNENNDQHWKELADHLRKLNVDYYWRIRNRISEENARNIGPPSRPVRSSGMGISMSMMQEYAPPILPEETHTENPDKPVTEMENQISRKGGFR